jgi:5-methyltetrahydrofolate--homocysteine methyltransferase
MAEASGLYEAVLKGRHKAAVELTRNALAAGDDPETLITTAMIPAMDEVGRLFAANKYYIPELMISARAMKSALEILRPLLTKKGAKPAGRVVIGTVQGDVHDIGKNLVASMLEGGGFEVRDAGVDVPAESFVAAVREGAEVLALSALLTTTMPAMRQTLAALRDAGVRDRVKVLVGGAPITRQFADEIGADGFADSASGAVLEARRLLGIRG